ncbi:pirin family protein [Aquabacterium sp.]|uniref:pirin family protein n=1 Tax=Aquabacterium sp. TaxID=1872578 RepID=UPI0035C68433
MSIPVIERVAARESTLGEGLRIRRALPTRERRMVGAWCFLDHIGPITFGPDEGMHVGAHPHTCLQTFTWMIEGEIRHRDSLGSDQLIRPGQVNLMTAGHGISHTEDSPTGGQRVHAAQLWIALPPAQADRAPAFEHHAALPTWQHGGCTCTLLAGRWRGPGGEHTAPTKVHTPLVGLDVCSAAGGDTVLPLRPDFEHGLLPLEGSVGIAGREATDGAEVATSGIAHFAPGEFAYLAPGPEQLGLRLSPGARVLLLGGEPWRDPIVMWWNFVGPSKAHVIQAQADWEAEGEAAGAAASPRFGAVPGGEGRRLHAPPLPWKA